MPGSRAIRRPHRSHADDRPRRVPRNSASRRSISAATTNQLVSELHVGEQRRDRHTMPTASVATMRRPPLAPATKRHLGGAAPVNRAHEEVPEIYRTRVRKSTQNARCFRDEFVHGAPGALRRSAGGAGVHLPVRIGRVQPRAGRLPPRARRPARPPMTAYASGRSRGAAAVAARTRGCRRPRRHRRTSPRRSASGRPPRRWPDHVGSTSPRRTRTQANGVRWPSSEPANSVVPVTANRRHVGGAGSVQVESGEQLEWPQPCRRRTRCT